MNAGKFEKLIFWNYLLSNYTNELFLSVQIREIQWKSFLFQFFLGRQVTEGF